jgi:hypothetical protein
MKRSGEEFWHSSLAQIMTMIDMYADEMQMRAATMNNEHYEAKYFVSKEEVVNIKSMKEIPGW